MHYTGVAILLLWVAFILVFIGGTLAQAWIESLRSTDDSMGKFLLALVITGLGVAVATITSYL